MKNKIFIILNIVLLLFQLYECEILTYNNDEICFNSKIDNFENNFQIDDVDTTIELKDKMDRNVTIIEPKASYKFININPELIYIFETDSNDLDLNLNNSKALKKLNRLVYNRFLTVNNLGSESKQIKITSISSLNINIEQLTEYKYDDVTMKKKFSNVYIIDTKDNTNLISFFDSFEDYNEVYYTKYSPENISPKDIHPIKLDKFTSIYI